MLSLWIDSSTSSWGRDNVSSFTSLGGWDTCTMYGVHGTGEWGEQKGNTEEENGHIGGWIEVGVATWGTVLSIKKVR